MATTDGPLAPVLIRSNKIQQYEYIYLLQEWFCSK